MAAAMLLASSGPAIAGPPYVTDDPEPTQLGKWEVFTSLAGVGSSGGSAGEFGLDINYGAVRDLQLTLVLPSEYEHDRRTRRSGFGDVELGAKYLFIHGRDGNLLPDVSVYPTITLPTGRRGFGRGKVGVLLPVYLQKKVGDWTVFGGGSYEFNPGAGNQNFVSVGSAISRDLTDRLSIGGEIYHQTREERDGRSLTGLGLGGGYRFADHWSLIGSGGPIVQNRRLNGRYAFYIGLEFAN